MLSFWPTSTDAGANIQAKQNANGYNGHTDTLIAILRTPAGGAKQPLGLLSMGECGAAVVGATRPIVSVVSKTNTWCRLATIWRFIADRRVTSDVLDVRSS